MFMVAEVRRPDSAATQRARRYLDRLDELLQKETYVAGRVVTLADLCVAATVALLEAARISVAGFRHVDAWATRLRLELPYYGECNAALTSLLSRGLVAQPGGGHPPRAV
ncbi:PREDICTED: uncharacterized protein LOC106818712 [Priapulus caudatus]|uniref:Uncharacterized protein LOC106818712 n=1 Tax=Priapulus caudatus TaxID=37621 RepID=A0ABM1F353_PRICU|nr:PREDICTED: uncharacterized protein LOC106818712 [Priapulus caudatus]